LLTDTVPLAQNIPKRCPGPQWESSQHSHPHTKLDLAATFWRRGEEDKKREGRKKGGCGRRGADWPSKSGLGRSALLEMQLPPSIVDWLHA